MHIELSDTAEFFLAIGGILLLGLSCDYIGKKTSLPRVTLLLISGVFMGEHMLDLLPQSLTRNFEIVTDIALLVVGFLLGGKFDLKKLKEMAQFSMDICHRSPIHSPACHHWPIIFIFPSTDRFPAGMHCYRQFSPTYLRCDGGTQIEQPLLCTRAKSRGDG